MRTDISNSDNAEKAEPGGSADVFERSELDSVLGKATSALKWAEFDEVLSDFTATLKNVQREVVDVALTESDAIGAASEILPAELSESGTTTHAALCDLKESKLLKAAASAERNPLSSGHKA